MSGPSRVTPRKMPPTAPTDDETGDSRSVQTSRAVMLPQRVTGCCGVPSGRKNDSVKWWLARILGPAGRTPSSGPLPSSRLRRKRGRSCAPIRRMCFRPSVASARRWSGSGRSSRSRSGASVKGFAGTASRPPRNDREDARTHPSALVPRVTRHRQPRGGARRLAIRRGWTRGPWVGLTR